MAGREGPTETQEQPESRTAGDRDGVSEDTPEETERNLSFLESHPQPTSPSAIKNKYCKRKF